MYSSLIEEYINLLVAGRKLSLVVLGWSLATSWCSVGLAGREPETSLVFWPHSPHSPIWQKYSQFCRRGEGTKREKVESPFTRRRAVWKHSTCRSQIKVQLETLVPALRSKSSETSPALGYLELYLQSTFVSCPLLGHLIKQRHLPIIRLR